VHGPWVSFVFNVTAEDDRVHGPDDGSSSSSSSGGLSPGASAGVAIGVIIAVALGVVGGIFAWRAYAARKRGDTGTGGGSGKVAGAPAWSPEQSLDVFASVPAPPM